MKILVISDIHSNLIALNAVIKDAGSFDQIWCLGDIVGYGPQPNECIYRLKEFELLCVAGNHDLAATGMVNLWDFTDDARDIIFWTRHHLTTENRNWLEKLPRTLLDTGENISMVHASPRDPVWEYINDPGTARGNLERINTRICLFGHTHLPAVYRKPWDGLKIIEEQLNVLIPVRLTLDRMFINPGSVGQPRDEDPRASYAIIDLERSILTHHRTQYEFTATQALMKQEKFPGRLIRRLRFGQ